MKPLPLIGLLVITLTGAWSTMVSLDTEGPESQKYDNKISFSGDTLEWPRPRFSEREQERHELVTNELMKQGIRDSLTLQALRHVPRHLFIPNEYQIYAYQNRPLPIGFDQTISQPFIVGYMTQMLDLSPGEKVLEIGTGSGYQAAILSEITPYVYTIEIVEELGIQAKNRFDTLGYKTISTKIGDGYIGWAEHAPFDAIILTAAPPEIPDPLIEQLKPGGVLAAPIGKEGRTQYLTMVTKSEDGEVTIQRRLAVRFVPMTGKIQKEN